MKSICHFFFSGLSAWALAVLLTVSADAQAIDCAAVAKRVSSAIKANPEQVLTVVEDALVAYEECACEVVSAAIKSSNASADRVKQIVLVAVQTAETQAPAIAECAVAAAPEHAEAVRIAFAEAFNGKEAPVVAAAADENQVENVAETGETTATAEAGSLPVALDGSGDLPTMLGKEVLEERLSPAARAAMTIGDEAVFGAAPLPMGMAFLIPPVSASPIILEDEDEEVVVKVKVKEITRTRIVRTPSPPQIITRTVPVSPTSP